MMTRSHALGRFASFAVPVLLACSSVGAAWLWEPRQQITGAGSASMPGLEGAGVDEGVRGRTSGILRHQMVRVWSADDHGANHGYGYYVPIGPDWQPLEAWEEDREAVTDSAAGHHSTDLSIAVDSADDVFLAAEIFHWSGVAGDTSQPRIGYRHRTGSAWSTLHIISPDSLDWGANSPNVFLQEGTSGDTVHVTFNHGSGNDSDSLYHTRKAVLDSESAWESATMVTPTIGSTPNLRVDGAGRVHFLGRHKFLADSTYFLHFRGFPPGGSASWTCDSTIVSKHFNGGLAQGPGEPDDPPSFLTASGESTGVFYWLWAEDSTSSGDREKIVFFSRGDSTGSWTSRIALTEHDGSSSFFPTGALSDSMFHVVYSEPTRPPDYGAEPSSSHHHRLYHRYSRTPTNASSWSRPMDAVPEQRTFSIRPSMFAVGDTLFMLYVSHDDDDPTPAGDGDYEVWARKGFAIADTLETASETWSGVVYLDSDFEVQAGKSLTIEPGTRVFAAASSGSDKVELIVHGELLADGELDDPIIFHSYDGEGGPGDWGGIVFDLEAAPSGYGFTCSSHLYHTRIEDATAGVVMRRTGAPSMINVMFADIEGDRHILVDSTDVYVPYGGTWDLRAPTTVKAAAGIRSGSEIGTANGKVEIVVQGTMITAAPQGGWVKFEPVDVPTTATSGDEWGGLFFDWLSTGSLLESADIGYARTPISLFWQDATIRWSRIHHFADRAVWAGSSKSTGPRLLENTVFRDTTGTAMLSESKGHNGIVLNNVSDALISENVISLAGMTSTTAGGAAILVQNSAGKYGFCDQTSATPDTLAIADNHILGSGAAANTGLVKWSGISGDWFCGAGPRKAVVTGNVIRHWNGSGIDLVQAEDVQFTCNDVDSCFRAVNFSRDALDSVGVRFRKNALRIANDDVPANQEVVGTDSAPWLRLGPASSATGSNFLEARGEDDYVAQADTAAYLNAVRNRWRRNGFTHAAVDSILTYIKGPVSVAPPESTWTPCGGFAAEAPPAVAEMGDGHERDNLRQLDAEAVSPPERTSLVALRSPQGGAEVRFDLAGAPRRDVQVDVFNVAGRRVARLVDEALAGGRYGVSWSGRDGAGGRVGSGVYLVRLRAGSETFVAKTVLLH